MRKQLAKALGFHRMARIRSALNRLTRGRVGLYSTAAHYSSGPSAKVLRYYQYDSGRNFTCSTCGWKGRGDAASSNLFADLFDVRCPECDQMLLVVGYPTFDEIEDAASRAMPRRNGSSSESALSETSALVMETSNG